MGGGGIPPFHRLVFLLFFLFTDCFTVPPGRKGAIQCVSFFFLKVLKQHRLLQKYAIKSLPVSLQAGTNLYQMDSEIHPRPPFLVTIVFSSYISLFFFTTLSCLIIRSFWWSWTCINCYRRNAFIVFIDPFILLTINFLAVIFLFWK